METFSSHISYQSSDIFMAQNIASCKYIEKFLNGKQNTENNHNLDYICWYYRVLHLELSFIAKGKPFCATSHKTLNYFWSRGWIILIISPAPVSLIFCQEHTDLP